MTGAAEAVPHTAFPTRQQHIAVDVPSGVGGWALIAAVSVAG
jgi:hypothetical protein